MSIVRTHKSFDSRHEFSFFFTNFKIKKNAIFRIAQLIQRHSAVNLQLLIVPEDGLLRAKNVVGIAMSVDLISLNKKS